ncbi:MAG: phosphatidylserine/phosphatidylglycerophosphate/cardiolipin synthase family protein [Candidatus Zambryskibacteria bacterium]|nr:phosphatidylserine/phosphatidylglycerophosphate/cardiolipin synthase family protein [Candidatus Zambryskibacteria bacterium]
MLIGTPKFQSTVESITRSPSLPIETPIIIFDDGTKFLEDLLIEISGAKDSVTITNYIFHEGVMTNSIFDALIKKAEEGVAIRILLDAYGGRKAPEEKLEALREAGAKTAIFRPIRVRTLTRAHRRTHMRTIVIDGHIAYTGGLAFEDSWLGDGTEKDHWRDTMFKYDGAMARATQDQFNSLWRQTDGEILTGEAFYPSAYTTNPPRDESYFVSLFHIPAPDVSADLLDIIWLTISGAESHILLSTPYLTPPPEIVEALTEAVRRGVEVEIIVPGTYTDSKLIQSATRSYYEKLLEAGIRIFEYEPGRFHEKSLTVDGRWSLIGSANMDNRSASLNVENIFGIEDQEFALALEEQFEENKSRSKELLKADWHPNLFKQSYYQIVSLFAKQF